MWVALCGASSWAGLLSSALNYAFKMANNGVENAARRPISRSVAAQERCGGVARHNKCDRCSLGATTPSYAQEACVSSPTPHSLR